MGILRNLWFGPDPGTTDFHDNSNLGEIILATELQNGSTSDRRWAVATAYRGAQLLADLAAELPWFAFQGGKDDGARSNALPVRADENPSVLVRPDPFYTRSEFLRQIVLSLIWRGNAYLWKSAYVDGRPTTVQVLDPDRVSVVWDDRRTRLIYRYDADRRLPADQVDHLALNRLPGRAKGVGPFDAGSNLLHGSYAADVFARDLYLNDAIPSGKLVHPGRLNKTESDELLKAWQKGLQDGRKTAVLSGGIDYEPISMTPDQAQFLQSRAFNVSEVARLLGIPAHLLNASTGVAGSSGGSMTYTNVSMVFQELVRTTLAPVYLSRIEEAASGWLPRGQSVRFDTSEFDRPDPATRFAAHEVALRNKFMTVDEVRELEGMEPSDELNQEREENRAMQQEAMQNAGASDSGA